MRRSPHAPVAAVMALALALGWSATLTTDPTYLAAVSWPIGLVTGAALLEGRLGGYLVLQIGGFAVFASYLTAGAPAVESLGIASAQLIGAAVVVGVLTGFGDRPRAMILSESDIARYVAAACAGAGAGAVVIAAWNAAFTDVGVLRSALELGAAHLASQLVLLPWFVQRRYQKSLARLPEQVVQWVVTLSLALIVFTSTDQSALAFIVISALALGSRRLGTTASLAQLFVVTALVSALTLHGRGVFVGTTKLFGFESDISSLLMHTFSVCSALVVVPLVMTVGLQVERARGAAIERDRAQRIIQSAESVVIIGGDLDTITYFSRGAERLLGYTADEVVGRRVRLLSDAEVARLEGELDVVGFPEICRALMDRHEPYELQLRRKDGVERTHLASLRTVSGDGHLEFVLVSEDVTTRREEEAAQQAAMERLREVDAAKDAFVGGVSHELRTPLTTMTGFLELLEEGSFGPVTTEQRSALGRVAANNRRLLILVDDLLTFARLGSDEAVVERREIDLRDVVRGACDLVEPTWTSRGVTTDVLLPDHPVLVLGDPTFLERVVLNLVGNAVKFTAEGGTVQVGLTTDGDEAVLTVSDNGMGIPADEIDRLFSRFFRSRLAREQAVQGSGLGLSIAKAVVEAHDGRIDVASVEGEGTTMTARLPLHLAA